MALTLRRTKLDPVPAYEHLQDWTVFEDGEPVGRIYEHHSPARPEFAWFWSCTLKSPNARGVETKGYEPSFGQAKARFLASYQALRAYDRIRLQSASFII